jgi:hypothetical protein
MAKQSNSKKPRTPKTSKGIHGGGGKVTLTPLQRVLIRNAHPKRFHLQDTKPRHFEAVQAMHRVASA